MKEDSKNNTGELTNVTVLYCILVKNTTFDNDFVHFSVNVIKFGMLIETMGIHVHVSHAFCCYGNHFGRIL